MQRGPANFTVESDLEEPLWAVVELDFERVELRCTGRQSKWHGQDPWQVGLKEDDYQSSRELSRPAIPDRRVKIAKYKPAA